MKKLNRFIPLFSICFFLFSILSHSQSPQSFNYQLIARDTAGLVLSNRSIGIQVSVLKDASGGIVVYSEWHTATTNNYGLANLAIGAGNIVSGSFSAIDWGHHTHFLKLELDPEGGTNYFTMGTIQLVSVPYSLFAEKAGFLTDTNQVSKWTQSGNDIYNNNSGNVGIGTNTPSGKFIVKGDSTALATEPLFEVKNKDGDPVFVVYPDSVRIIISENASKATAQGGFAVSGRSSAKGATGDYLLISPDSARIYLNESPGKATAQGGFAVSGRSSSKGAANDYFNVSVDTNETILPGQPRILWYPTKEAFLTGMVMIESPDSVGKNSFASGFKSKAVGDYSQALGYQARAFGHNSSAIGNYAQAKANNSFAFGDSAIASGVGSYAFGTLGQDIIGFSTHLPSVASGDYSYVFGNGDSATARGAIAIGSNNRATGNFSTAMGSYSNATGDNSSTLGFYASASGGNSIATGSNTTAGGYGSTALGSDVTASGMYSTGMGSNSVSGGYVSTATGYYTRATGDYSFTSGQYTRASGEATTALGSKIEAAGNYSFGISLNYPGSQYLISDDNTLAIMGGEVGIGTTSPGCTLDVNGTTKLGAYGTSITNVIKTTVNADLPIIINGASVIVSFAVNNAQPGSSVMISPQTPLYSGLIIQYARVSGANTVSVRFYNASAAAIDMLPMDFYITVIQ